MLYCPTMGTFPHSSSIKQDVATDNAFSSFKNIVQLYFLEFLKLFFPTACGNKKISSMVGNEPYLGGQRNIIVCPSLNCC